MSNPNRKTNYPRIKNKSITIILKIYLGKKTEHNFFQMLYNNKISSNKDL